VTTLAFILLLTAAIACLGLSRIVATRTLGLVATGAALAAALALAASMLGSGTPGMPVVGTEQPIIWVNLEQVRMRFTLHPFMGNQPLSLVLMCGGALSLFVLSQELSPTVRGFGRLFAWSLLALAAALLGLVVHGALIAVAWVIAALCSYSAVRASGTLPSTTDPETPRWGIATALLASLLLFGGLLVSEPARAQGAAPPTFALACIGLASLIFAGSAPFHHMFDELVEAPAALWGLSGGLILPILAFGTLIRFVADLHTTLPDFVLPLPLSLAASGLGLLSMFACAAGALREHSLRRLLAWQVSGHAGAVVLALGLAWPQAELIASALLVNLVWSTLAGALAVAMLEHQTGSDDFTQEPPAQQGASFAFKAYGLVWALAAMSALGLPPFLGFSGKYWLVQEAIARAPWTVPLMLAATGLAALAYLAPLARFWWYGSAASPDETAPTRPPAVVPALFQSPLITYGIPALLIAPLLSLGIDPYLLWGGWLQGATSEALSPPVAPLWKGATTALALFGGALILLLSRARWSRKTLSDPDMGPVILAPDGLARNLAPLAWMGRPDSLVQSIWKGALLLSRGVQIGLSPFEQRHYLSGLLLALISLIVLMALQP
jgi:formate hydrogenlyase subunit 3/multisubunit Na+/H+ antiporter MnhD subunit